MGGGDVSLAVMDFGVGMAEVGGRSIGASLLEVPLRRRGVVVVGGRGEEREVSVERGEGVERSIVGEGGRRTRDTASSSRSVSVPVVVAPMVCSCIC